MSDILEMPSSKIPQNSDAQDIYALKYILDMPDGTFKAIYPSLKEEYIKAFKNGEFESSVFQEGITKEQKKAVLESFKNIAGIYEENGACSEKIDFINLISDTIERLIDEVGYRDSVAISIEYCDENAKEPTYSNPTDAGCDVYSIEDITIPAGKTVIVRTGLKVAVPVGWMLSVRPRSGMSARTGIRVANAPGTIDTGFRQEVGIILHNTSNTPYDIHTGDRIAQFVIEQAPLIKFKKVEDISQISGDRGGGFGHSGV